MYSFKTMWKTPSFLTRNIIQILNTNVKSVLLYGSETWSVTQATIQNTHFHQQMPQKHLTKNKTQENVTNTEVMHRTNQIHIKKEIQKRKRPWIGNPFRRDYRSCKTSLSMESIGETKNRTSHRKTADDPQPRN